ncbi:hypothetical protein [Clostridium sp.]|uniref:hypothetical protein n=1 Tax=Clostridium sp. TaxID=1506 RepID=UPI001A44566D|nr:hypothetical protein [Clostridium sp.]MBK5242135.1 hypothetical protein [Clostridium sp.]
MKVIIMKLKRYKTVYWILNILMMPIRLPIFIIFKVGEFAEKGLELTDNIAYKLMNWIVKTFKFEEIATEQRKTNKDKFKNNFNS